MQVLVVHAQPDPEAFGAAVCARVLSGLDLADHDVELIDLYAEDYDPVLRADELSAYETIAADHPDPVVKRHIDLVRWADALIVVYPTYWSGMPAILKGWLERTLLPGVAFRLDPGKKTIAGTLQLRHLVGVTTYGSPRSYRWLVGDGGRRTLLRCVRLVCGRRCRSTWLSLDKLDGRPNEEREAFLTDVEAAMGAL